MASRRTFTQEFKVGAVGMVTQGGSSLSEVAQRLGIGANLLRKWKQSIEADGEQAFPGSGHQTALEEENRRLRAENERLRMEREILKKATVFFAKESR